MPLKATLVNALWSASNLRAYGRFLRGLRNPQNVQRKKLQGLLEQNANTTFGKAHAFQKIRSYEEFAARVPLTDYTALEPWIARIRRGEQNILTHDRVTHLIPTSGSTGARKLIPFTSGLQHEFNAAIAPWLVDLTRQSPRLLGGPAYWSISPAIVDKMTEASVVPIGFDADTAYLGGGRRRLAEAVMAVPSNLGRATSLDVFRYETLLHLLQCRELRLISVWHPSFLTLLLDALPGFWERLLTDIKNGSGSALAGSRRAEELRAAGPFNPGAFWPRLCVISCWGDGAASLALEGLRSSFPQARIQPKGLIATEAFVTLPFSKEYPLAVHSHFFEFIDSRGRAFTADALRKGDEYEVVVTTAGGLWRYRLADRVRVNAWVQRTPSLKFIGRGEQASDLFGEKLSETFIIDALRELFGRETPQFALLAPDEDEIGCRYTLYVEGEVQPHWAESLDRQLQRNPHYAYCRALGQLLPLRLYLINERGFETFARQQAARGARLGDIKAIALCEKSGWSKAFSGSYIEPAQDLLPTQGKAG